MSETAISRVSKTCVKALINSIQNVYEIQFF